MDTPQIVYLMLAAVSGTITAMSHGKPHPKYNFFSWAIAVAIDLGILYWGGFFS